MNGHMKEAFSRMKPLCDLIMVNPSPEHVSTFAAMVCELKKDLLQELQQYMLFPFITHIQSKEIVGKYELQRLLIDGMKVVLQRVRIFSFEMCMKIEMGLLGLVFEKPKPGMIADVPEELKLSVIQCLTILMLNVDHPTRVKLVQTQVPMLAQAIFVSVHLAKLEKLRVLRLAAINCLCAHTASHPQLTDKDCHITDPVLETAVVNMMSCILPGVMAALQDVATCTDNPGHAIVVAALNATHRVLCLTMHNKHLPKKDIITADDFVSMLSDRAMTDKDVSNIIRDVTLSAIIASRDYHSLAEFIRSGRDLEATSPNVPTNKRDKGKGSRAKNKRYNNGNNTRDGNHNRDDNVERASATFKNSGLAPKDIPKRTPEWYAMAGDKLTMVVKSLVPLVTHEHYKVRKELAVLCYRIVSECSSTMQLSLTMALDVLISLSNDPYKEVSEYASNAINSFFSSQSETSKMEAIDSMCENFFTTLNCLPRILNNIDSNRKLSALYLLQGYLRVLCGGRPQRLTGALCASDGYDRLCDALLCAASHHSRHDLLVRHSTRDVSSPAPLDGPWRRLRHLDTRECELKLQEVCQKLGEAECAELFLDRLLELFHERRTCELVYVINFVGSAPNSSPNLAKRIIAAYTEEDVWYQPLEVGSADAPLEPADTLDADVYNPRAWTKDSVPGLYEGATEIRYTDISLSQPRIKHVEPNTCASLAEAQRNMAFCCLVTEGLGLMARRLKRDYQPYLLKTLCLILERVGSQYQYLHEAGLMAINSVAFAFDHEKVADLIAENADYFTSQISSRLKRAWNTESALQILSVVMEYSDESILDCLYGIVEDVLVQSCDKYYESYLSSYLQVFETFIKCIRNWFPEETKPQTIQGVDLEIDVIKETIDFANNTEEVERLMNTEEFEAQSGRSVEEMYKEDLKRREEDILDYDDTVEYGSEVDPQHIQVTVTILRRCVHFVPSQRDTALQALRVLAGGLPALRARPHALLPLAHALWPALAARVRGGAPAELRAALHVLLALSALARDFLRARAVRDVLPHLYKYLRRTANDSHLKDTGSAYRVSQAYYLQVAILTSMSNFVIDLMLDGENLDDAMSCAQIYLSKNQPKPLQMLAVKFFKDILNYNYGAAWNHLRKLCANDCVLQPPHTKYIRLEPIVGTPYETINTNYDTNVKLIFYVHK
ncbi:TELO2-interacting protein 1 homolog isoform X2 [Vanessa tameamea]|uniref:TELO2-interacting protein 1 homolog isoform X2 n=1 Tax=Vanessa tameamea TaxID=334116 RepID=A0ABM4AMU9_VANTA